MDVLHKIPIGCSRGLKEMTSDLCRCFSLIYYGIKHFLFEMNFLSFLMAYFKFVVKRSLTGPENEIFTVKLQYL